MTYEELIKAFTETQCAIIARSLDKNYSLEESIKDIDTIADLTMLKIVVSRRVE